MSTDNGSASDETLIFHFEVGGRHQARDPFRVERLLVQALAGEPLAEVLRAAQAQAPALSEPAIDKLLAAARHAFGLEPVDAQGQGCTEKAQLRVLREFLRWRAEVKNRPFAGASPTSSAPTALPSSVAPAPTRNSTPSGC